MGSTRSTSITTPSFFQCLQIAKSKAIDEALGSNFVFSPWSIQLALSLLANYTGNSTKLLKFLEAENLDDLNSYNKQLLDSLTRIHEESAAKINSINKSSMKSSTGKKLIKESSVPSESEGSVDLKIVGGVWVDQSVDLSPTFKTIAEDIYKGRAETVDFQDKAKHKEITDGVNKWDEEATNGLIKSVLSQRLITQLTRIVLANALYFRGKWDKVFNKSRTKEHKFYLLDGNSVDVSFMSHDNERYIYDSEDFKILRLPYAQSSISMYIILPSTGDQVMPLLEKVVSDPTFIDSHPLKRVTGGAFRIPKFKISCEFDATKYLQHVLNNERVIHNSRIEIDEEGTEAAAVTIIIYKFAYGESETESVDFVADHPFIYMVRDRKSGTVLFMGYVVNPLLQ